MSMCAASLVTLIMLTQGHPHHDHGPATPGGEPVGGPTSVFVQFPTDPAYYQPEVAELVREGVVERFGVEEWAAIVVSHEIHQHIGVYTIVGAKMGVRASELLDAPRRAVSVTIKTVADSPMACAVDGVQASMGSTYGQHLIHLVNTRTPGLEATFRLGDETLRMTLKPEYLAKVRGFIDTHSAEHGYLSAPYFEAIRGESYRVWAEWDRSVMFDETLTETASDEAAEADAPVDGGE